LHLSDQIEAISRAFPHNHSHLSLHLPKHLR
jgi:hypothetical protein